MITLLTWLYICSFWKFASSASIELSAEYCEVLLNDPLYTACLNKTQSNPVSEEEDKCKEKTEHGEECKKLYKVDIDLSVEDDIHRPTRRGPSHHAPTTTALRHTTKPTTLAPTTAASPTRPSPRPSKPPKRPSKYPTKPVKYPKLKRSKKIFNIIWKVLKALKHLIRRNIPNLKPSTKEQKHNWRRLGSAGSHRHPISVTTKKSKSRCSHSMTFKRCIEGGRIKSEICLQCLYRYMFESNY